jgi:hypothetical protein
MKGPKWAPRWGKELAHLKEKMMVMVLVTTMEVESEML